MTRARADGWIAPGGRRIAVLTLGVLAFLVAEETGVNYFVAAFVAGFAFRAGTGEDDEEATELPELIGRVLALAVWFVFGAGLLLDGLELVDWRIALYAVAQPHGRPDGPGGDQHDRRGFAVRRRSSSGGSVPGAWPRWSSGC